MSSHIASNTLIWFLIVQLVGSDSSGAECSQTRSRPMLQSEWKHLGYNAGRYLGKLIKFLGYAPGSPAVRGLLRFIRAPPSRQGSKILAS